MCKAALQTQKLDKIKMFAKSYFKIFGSWKLGGVFVNLPCKHFIPPPWPLEDISARQLIKQLWCVWEKVLLKLSTVLRNSWSLNEEFTPFLSGVGSVPDDVFHATPSKEIRESLKKFPTLACSSKPLFACPSSRLASARQSSGEQWNGDKITLYGLAWKL